MKINESEWKPEFVERLKKHEEAIDYMEKMYGIGIEEWETTMNPLHYLDALSNFYQLKQADVICSVCDCEAHTFYEWEKDENKCSQCNKRIYKQTDL